MRTVRSIAPALVSGVLVDDAVHASVHRDEEHDRIHDRL